MRIILIFCVLIISSCQSETSFEFSTYWWKSNTKLNTQQKEFLNTNNINKIYLRIFDLKFDEKNSSILIPKVYSGFNNINTIPVIYIENKIFSNFNIDTIYNLIQQNIKLAIEKRIINSTNKLYSVLTTINYLNRLIKKFCYVIHALQVYGYKVVCFLQHTRLVR